MDAATIVLIAFGLAMDAFAVSIANGATTRKLGNNGALKMATFFGAFQAFMPVIGWLAGLSVIDFISGFDHWIAFLLLVFIGCKMIYESITLEPNQRPANPLNTHTILALSIATSIDALAVGLSFAFLKIFIAIPVIVIGAVTFTLSLAGVYIGSRLGHFFEKKIEVAGGLVLIGIGVKILIEHLLI